MAREIALGIRNGNIAMHVHGRKVYTYAKHRRQKFHHNTAGKAGTVFTVESRFVEVQSICLNTCTQTETQLGGSCARNCQKKRNCNSATSDNIHIL